MRQWDAHAHETVNPTCYTQRVHARLKSFMPEFRNAALIRLNRRSLNHSNTVTAHLGQQYKIKHHTLAFKEEAKITGIIVQIRQHNSYLN